jgi:hypothetical protein
VAIFYCLRFETSLFVAFYDSKGHGGGIRPRLHTGYCSAGVLVTNRVENTVSNSSSIVARGLVAVGTCLFRGRYLVTGLHPTILSSHLSRFFLMVSFLLVFALKPFVCSSKLV